MDAPADNFNQHVSVLVKYLQATQNSFHYPSLSPLEIAKSTTLLTETGNSSHNFVSWSVFSNFSSVPSLCSFLRAKKDLGASSECLRSSHLSSSSFWLFVSFKLVLRARVSCSRTHRTPWYKSCLRCRPLISKLSCLAKGFLSSLDVFLAIFLSCLPRWKCSGDNARLNSGDPGLGEVWGVMLAKCGDAGDPRKVRGEVLRGWCEWPWGWEGDTEVGEGVLARGDTGTCVEDFRLGERTALNFGIRPCRDPERNYIKIELHVTW